MALDSLATAECRAKCQPDRPRDFATHFDLFLASHSISLTENPPVNVSKDSDVLEKVRCGALVMTMEKSLIS